MMTVTKTALAAALLAGAATAQADLVYHQGASNELFLSVYDQQQGKTYNLDTNVTLAQLQTNAAVALSAFGGAGYNLAGDSKWQTFAGGFTASSQIKYALAVGDTPNSTAALTGNTPVLPPQDPTVLFGSDKIDQHAKEINEGLAGSVSSIIDDFPDTFTGQFEHNGVPAVGAWNGWPYDQVATLGVQTGFWLVGNHVGTIPDPLTGDPVQYPLFTNDDVKFAGNWILTGDTLKFTAAPVTPVPVPAAVWLFGAGLMSMLRLARRQ